MHYFRYGGQVDPRVPVTAPMSYRLSQEVYALDGLGQYERTGGTALCIGLGVVAGMLLYKWVFTPKEKRLARSAGYREGWREREREL